jgi:hypothetical protein
MDRHHQFTRRQRRAAHAGDELPKRQATVRGPGDLDLGVERQQTGHAIGRRRGVADIAGERAGVLDLAAADLAGGLLQAVEQGRQIGLQKLAPGRRGAQPPARRAGRNAAQNVDSADIEHVFVDRPADPRRVEIGAAGENGVRPRQCAQRLFKAAWTKVDTHIVRVRTMPQAPCESNE